jgi:hypothetical protein
MRASAKKHTFAVVVLVIVAGQLKVENWFLRSNEKVFFEPEKQAIETKRRTQLFLRW